MPLLSVWQAAHQRTPLAAPLVEGHFDVIVVGGGITGATTALQLGKAGTSVLLVEARRLAAGTTGGSTAKVSALQGTQLGRIARRHGQGVVDQYVTATLEAQSWVTRFCEDHAVTAQHRPAYTYATTTRGLRAARREHRLAQRAGLPVTWVDEPALPFATRGAVRLDDQLQVDPVDLVDTLAEQARSHGVQVVEGARVERVRGRGPVRVETSAGTATADRVVVATNLPVLDRGAWFARLKPARSYSVAFRTPVPAVDGMYLSADSTSRSLRDAELGGESLLLVGGEGHTTGRGGPTGPRLDALREFTAEHFPQAEETHAWSAQDYLPSHGLPVAGPLLPGRDEVLVAGGFAKWGMTSGVAAALALTGRILGSHQEWASVLEPWTRSEVTGLPTAAVANAEVGLEMTAGWVRPVVGSVPGAGSGPGGG